MEVGISVKLDGNKALIDADELYQRLERARLSAAGIKIPSGAASSINQTAVAAENLSSSSTRATLSQARAQIASGNWAGAVTTLGSALQNSNQKINEQSSSVSGLTKQVFSMVGAYISLRGVMSAGREMIESRIEIDRLNIGMKAIAPDARTAAEAEAFLISKSNELGMSIQDTIPEFIKMNAAFTQSGMSFKQTQTVFTDVSTAVKALGLSSATVGRILYDFQEMASLGTVQMRQMRQVMMQIPGGMEIAARSIHVTTEQLHEMIRAGTIDPSTFIPAFTHELANTFGSALPEAVDTLESHLNRAKNSATLFWAELGNNAGIKYAVDALGSATKALTPNSLDQERIETERRKLVFGKNYNEQTGANMSANPLEIIGEKLYPQSFISDEEVQKALDAEDKLRAKQKDRATLAGGGTLSFAATNSEGDMATDKQIEAANKFWDIYDKARTQSLSGEARQRQEIIDKFAKELRDLPKDIPMRGLLADQIRESKTDALAQFDNNQLEKKAERMSEIEQLQKRLNVETAPDEVSRRLISLNQEYDSLQKKIINMQEANEKLPENLQIQPSEGETWEQLAARIEQARQRAISEIRQPKSPLPYANENVSELYDEREKLKHSLLSSSSVEEYRANAQKIQEISEAMRLKLEADSASLSQSFTLGFKETVQSWGTASQRMAQVGSEAADSIASNFTNAFMSMADGTKSPEQAVADMSRAIVADLMRILIEEMIVKQIMSAIGGFGMGVGSGGLSSSAIDGSATFSAPFSGVGSAGVGVAHSGGIIGNLPRYHSGGILGDEMPIVGRKGEGVFTPDQMKALGERGGSGGTNVHVVNISDPRQAEQYIAANPHAIINSIASSPGAMNSLRRMLN